MPAPSSPSFCASSIIGTGSYMPDKVLTNDDLSKIVDTSDEWITSRTGIKERRIAAEGQATSDLAAEAARRAMENAGVSAEEIKLIIVATVTPDMFFPSTACFVQKKLGAVNAVCFDISAACSGFLYALQVARHFINTGNRTTALVIGAEKLSSLINWKDRNTCVLFGDGAGAVVLQPTEEPGKGILANRLHSDGTHAEKLAFINPGAHGGYHNKYLDEPVDYGYGNETYGGIFLTDKMMEEAMTFPYMDGPFVFKMAVQKFPEVIQEVLGEAGVTAADLGMLISHLSNLRISQFVQRTLRLRDDQVWNNIQKYGNTTAASVPIALCEALEAGAIRDGDLVCLAAFGSGFTWGANLLRWG